MGRDKNAVGKGGVRHAHTLPVFADAGQRLSPSGELSTGYTPTGRMTFRDGTPKLPEGMGGIYEDFDAFDSELTHGLNDRRDSLRYFAGER